MFKKIKELSLAPRGIRHKLAIAFALMSVIPVLVCGYLIVSYIFPTMESFKDVTFIFLICIFLMLLGFYVVHRIIFPVIEISAHAKNILKGENLDKSLEERGEDEIGQLSGSLNRLSVRLKENMGELRSYGEKIKEINMEINKKVFALSSLLQIGNLITTEFSLEEVFRLIVEKLSQLDIGGAAFLMLLEKNSNTLSMRAQANLENEDAKTLKVKIGQGIIGKVFENATPTIKDKQKIPQIIDLDFEKQFPVRNFAVLPIISSGKVIGIIGTGNNVSEFIFSNDELELIGVFGKQAAVALENNDLLRKTEELAVIDELTGLYNESYIRNRLDEEIRRATSYQRPCALIVLEVDNFDRYRDTFGETAAEKALKKIAQILKESTTDIDKVSRFNDHQFALVLPEKNRRQILNIAENARKEAERFAQGQKKLKPPISTTLSGGISATPIDGTTSVELINKALTNVAKAKNEGSNKIIST